jgi:hypothetical protein
MKKSGSVVTAFYFLVLICLVIPVAGLTLPPTHNTATGEYFRYLRDLFSLREVKDSAFLLVWSWVGLMVAGEALLLWLSVDTSAKRPSSRQHILLSVLIAAAAIGLLTQAVVYALVAVIGGKDNAALAFLTPSPQRPLLAFGALWLFWGITFYVYSTGRSLHVSRIVGWLLKGSVLELLVVVPSHVFLRRRGDCSAPAATAFGIATGLAIMLMSFGPSVLFLYWKRLQKTRKSANRLSGA